PLYFILCLLICHRSPLLRSAFLDDLPAVANYKLHPRLQPNNLPPYTLPFVIHIQHSNTAPRLPAPIRRTSRIKEQLPVMLLIPGNMTMSKYHHSRIGKFLPCHPRMRPGITQNMHHTYPATTNNHLAL